MWLHRVRTWRVTTSIKFIRSLTPKSIGTRTFSFSFDFAMLWYARLVQLYRWRGYWHDAKATSDNYDNVNWRMVTMRDDSRSEWMKRNNCIWCTYTCICKRTNWKFEKRNTRVVLWSHTYLAPAERFIHETVRKRRTSTRTELSIWLTIWHLFYFFFILLRSTMWRQKRSRNEMRAAFVEILIQTTTEKKRSKSSVDF